MDQTVIDLDPDTVVALAKARLTPAEFEQKIARVRQVWARDEAVNKLATAKKLIEDRMQAAIALANALTSIARLTSALEDANQRLTKLELLPDARASLGSALAKLPRDVRDVLDSRLPAEVREVDQSKFRAQVEAVHEALLAAVLET